MAYVTGYLFISEDLHLVVYKHSNAVAQGLIQEVQLPFVNFFCVAGINLNKNLSETSPPSTSQYHVLHTYRLLLNFLPKHFIRRRSEIEMKGK